MEQRSTQAKPHDEHDHVRQLYIHSDLCDLEGECGGGEKGIKVQYAPVLLWRDYEVPSEVLV